MKKVLYILSLAFLCIALVAVLIVTLLKNSQVQLAIIKTVTSQISKLLNTNVGIGAIEYHFPTTISIHNIYIEDQQQDTLLFVEKISAFIQPTSLKKNELDFPYIDIANTKIYTYTLPDGTPNYQFLLQLFPKRSSFSWNMPMRFHIDNFNMTNALLTYNDYTCNVDHVNIEIREMVNNDIDFQLHSIKGSMSNATDSFVVENGSFAFVTNDTNVTIPKFSLKTQHSHCYLSHIAFHQNIVDIIGSLVEKDSAAVQRLRNTSFDFYIDDAVILPADFSFFTDRLKRFNEPLFFKIGCAGTLNDIEVNTLSLRFDAENQFDGTAHLQNITSLPNASVEMEVNSATMQIATIQDIIGKIKRHPFRLPKQIQSLQFVQMQGKISGDMQHLQYNGVLKTKPGILSTNINIAPNNTLKSASIEAQIQTTAFNLKQMHLTPKLGKITTNINIRCLINQKKEVEGSLVIDIPSVQWNNYTYRHLSIKGEAFQKKYALWLTSKDKNIALSSSALLNVRDSLPDVQVQMQIDNFAPHPLNLTHNFRHTQCKIKNVQANFKASNLENINGKLILDSLTIISEDSSVIMDKLEFIASSDHQYKNFRLISDFLTGKVEGIFSFSELVPTMQKFAMYYLPNLFSDRQIKRILEHSMTGYVNFYVYGYNIASVQHILKTPVSVGDFFSVKGYINGIKNKWETQCYFPFLNFKKQTINDIVFQTDNNGNKGRVALSASYKNTNYTLNSRFADNKVDVVFTSHRDSDMTSEVQFSTTIEREDEAPIFNMHIAPSQFFFNNSDVWIDKANIQYVVKEKRLSVDRLRVHSDIQSIDIAGVCSPAITDSMTVLFQNVDVRPLMAIAVPVERFSVGGYLSGNATAFAVFSTPMVEADVELDSAHLNESHIGTAFAKASFDKKDKTISIIGDVVNKEKLTAHVIGLVEPLHKKWGLDIHSDSVNIGFINHWTQDILTNIDGAVYGNVKVFGENGKTWVLARAYAHKAELTIPYTGCTYYLNDSVFMDSTSIRFPNTFMTDQEGNKLYIDGIMQHVNFDKFRFSINAQTDHTLSINIPDTEGELIQGKVYSSGNITIEGDQKQVTLNADIKSVGDSRFRMSVSSPTTAQDNHFITFVNKNNTDEKTDDKAETTSKTFNETNTNKEPRQTTFLLHLNIDVDPTLLFQLAINERTGDIIEGRGNGKVQFNMENNAEKMQMTGTYTLETGTFNFTIGNIIKKTFSIGSGSTVRWSGVPQSPELDIIAKYTVTASLKDLFGDEILALPKSRTSIPVNACIALQGTLNDPLITYFIELPQAEDFIKDQVKSIMNTGEMVTKQVLYLLIFGKFFTPDYLANASSSSLTDTYSLVSSTVSGQINAWISKLTTVFSMGVNIRNESDGNSEYEAQFQLQPIDQLIINGNIGYRYNDISNRPLFGDIDLEYKILPDGKIRLKAYSHSVDKYSLRQAATTQGIGFVFKHNFNFGKRKKKK